jgi:predicted ArsR family transcriptional regulator
VETTRWQALAALVDPVRRALYEHVRQQDHPVTREEAAGAVAISRTLTAFHLDKLVEAWLLVAGYAPPQGRRGRGRAPKVYRPTQEGLTLSLPPRQYELIGRILADAVADAPADARTAALRHAREYGRDLGTSCQARPVDAATQVPAAYAALADLGFEPRTTDDGIALSNCPFHALAQRQTSLVCGLNEAFVSGLLDGLGAGELAAELAPQPGSCCVRIDSARYQARPASQAAE